MNKIVRDKGRAVCSTVNITFKQRHYFHLGTDSLKEKHKILTTKHCGEIPTLPARKLQHLNEGIAAQPVSPSCARSPGRCHCGCSPGARQVEQGSSCSGSVPALHLAGQEPEVLPAVASAPETHRHGCRAAAPDAAF